MGASGIEGTMRRSCEVTMTMLRDQRQIIITLLQVLLYDPLFTWAITPEKACKMQSDVVRTYSENSGRGKANGRKNIDLLGVYRVFQLSCNRKKP